MVPLPLNIEEGPNDFPPHQLGVPEIHQSSLHPSYSIVGGPAGLTLSTGSADTRKALEVDSQVRGALPDSKVINPVVVCQD